MEHDSNGSGEMIGRALARDLNGMLEQDGILLADRTILIPEALTDELDVADVVIGRNDQYSRTVCHVHRPSNENFFWRHDTYMVWDDGRTAYFSIDMGLDDEDTAVMSGLDAADEALKQELRQLVSADVIDVPAAGTLHDQTIHEVNLTLEEVNEALLRAEEMDEVADMTVIVDDIMRRRLAIRQAEAAADAPAFAELRQQIDNLHAAHREAILMRVRLNEFYLALSEQMILEAEAGDGTPLPPKESWDLLQLLDKVSDF